MRIVRALWQFTMSIKFGVALILFLMFVMMFATQFEASTSTRAMKHFIYSSLWFDIAVYLFVLNIMVNTWRRRPYKFRHIGFLTVHVGVLVIVAGGLGTRYFGIDGTMPIPEGERSTEIALPETDLIVRTAGAEARHETAYDLTPWVQDVDDLYRVPGMPYWIHVDRYYPTGAVVDSLVPTEEPNPIVELAVGGSGREPRRHWLESRNPARNSLNIAGAQLHLREEADSTLTAWDAAQDPETGPAGTLTLHWADGSTEDVTVPQDAERVTTSRSGVEVEVLQVFRSFTLTSEGHADAVDKPANPAIRFRVVGGPSSREEHFSFTEFPEFRAEAPEGESWLLSYGAWTPDPATLGHQVGQEMLLVPEGHDRVRVFTSWGHGPPEGEVLEAGHTHSFDHVLLHVLKVEEKGRLVREVVKASDEVMRPVIRVNLMQEGDAGVQTASFVDRLGLRPSVRPADVEPNRAWLFHEEAFHFETDHGPIDLRFETRFVPLDFAIHLHDFVEEKYPGISTAASFESHVTVHPRGGEPFDERIYMNHPLIYEGYTFYQASFQRTPSGEEITVLSVARDPGMTISFIGYCILTVGLVLIFFGKSFFRKLDDRRAARLRTQAGGAS